MNKAENKKKLFSSGGIFVDFFIGVLIAACIAGVVYRCFIYNPNAHAAQTYGTYTVYYEIVDAQPGFAAYLEQGDKVYVDGLLVGIIPASHELTEQGETDAEEQETAEQETAEQETAEQETAEQETAEQETAEQETAEQETAEQETESAQYRLSFCSDANDLEKGTLLSYEQGTLIIRNNEQTMKFTPGQILEIYTDTVCVNVRILQVVAQTEE